MTLGQYLNGLVNRWKLIILCVVLLGVAAYFGSKLMKPIYQSTALVQIGFSSANNQTDYNSLLASDQLVQTETTLATSDTVFREVAKHYQGLTASALSKEVTASPRTNTQLFEIDVTDPSPVRAAALANDIANTLIQQQTQMEQTNFLFLVQPARSDSSPVQPNVRLNTAAGLLAGLLLGLALALLFEQLDTHVRTSEEISQLLGRPEMASILQAKPKEDLIDPAENNTNAEAYRILRTNIGFAEIDKPLRTILVTSATPGDGKSLVAVNLAIFMARAGRNTLLIEADLRHPSLYEQFNFPAQTPGFSNVIMEFAVTYSAKAPAERRPSTSTRATGTPPARGVSLDPFIYAVDTPNLCIMPSGTRPPNPSELLDSKAMQRFITALDDCEAEVIIFDAPALLGLSDASILASKVDGTLVVVDRTRAKRGDLKQLKAILDQAGAYVPGYVINKHPRRRDHAIYSYYPTTHEQAVSIRQRRKNGRIPLETPHIMKEPKTDPQQEDVFDATIKFGPVHPAKVNAQSQPDLSDTDTVDLTNGHPAAIEARSRPDMLDGSKKA